MSTVRVWFEDWFPRATHALGIALEVASESLGWEIPADEPKRLLERLDWSEESVGSVLAGRTAHHIYHAAASLFDHYVVLACARARAYGDMAGFSTNLQRALDWRTVARTAVAQNSWDGEAAASSPERDGALLPRLPFEIEAGVLLGHQPTAWVADDRSFEQCARHPQGISPWLRTSRAIALRRGEELRDVARRLQDGEWRLDQPIRDFVRAYCALGCGLLAPAATDLQALLSDFLVTCRAMQRIREEFPPAWMTWPEKHSAAFFVSFPGTTLFKLHADALCDAASPQGLPPFILRSVADSSDTESGPLS